jgi:hypothetical protein
LRRLGRRRQTADLDDLHTLALAPLERALETGVPISHVSKALGEAMEQALEGSDPGDLTLISLMQTTTSVLLSPSDPSLKDVFAAKLIQRLTEDARRAFFECENLVRAKPKSS